MPCKCRTPNSLVGPTGGVFSKMVVLDYYDGIVTAVARCLECKSAFLVTVVAWEPSRHKTRVYALAEISEKEYSGVLQVLEAAKDAQNAEATAVFEGGVAALLKTPRPPVILLAADDLDRSILAACGPQTAIKIIDPLNCVSEARLNECLAYLRIRP